MYDARKSETGISQQRWREGVLIIDHEALVVIGRSSRVRDSNAAQRRAAARNTICRRGIKRRFKITEFPEYNGF